MRSPWTRVGAISLIVAGCGGGPKVPVSALEVPCVRLGEAPRQIVQGRPPRDARFVGAKFSPGDRYVAAEFVDDSVHVFDVATRRKVASHQCRDACTIAWTSDAQLDVLEKDGRYALDVARNEAKPAGSGSVDRRLGSSLVPQTSITSASGRFRVTAKESRVILEDAHTNRTIGGLGSELAEPLELAIVGSSLAVLERDRVSVWSIDRGELLRSVAVRGPLGLDVDESGRLVVVRSDPADTACADNPRNEAGGPITALHVDTWKDLVPPSAPSAPVCIERLAGQNESRYGSNGRAYGLTMKALDVVHGVAIMRLRSTRLGSVDLRTGQSTLVSSGVALTSAALAGDGRAFVTSSSNTTTPMFLLGRGESTPRRREYFENLRAPDAIALSHDGSRVAMSMGERVRILPMTDGATLPELSAGARVTTLQFDARDALWLGTGAGEIQRYEQGKVTLRGVSSGGAIRKIRQRAGAAFMATISDDGAVRIWDAARATLRATLVRFGDGEWAALTPGGAYNGTPEVGDRIGWAFAEPPETFSFEQFSAAYRAPALVSRRLRGEEVDAQACMGRPPRVELAREAPAEVSGATATLSLRTHGNVEGVRAFVEGRLAAQTRAAPGGSVDIDVPLLAGLNRVTVHAFDATGSSSNALVIDVTSKRAGVAPTLFVVAAGVSRYPSLAPGMQLPAAANDARGIVEAFRAHVGPARQYGAMRETVLVDGAATPASIRAALSSLSQMGKDDTGVVLLAGHGFKPSPTADMVFATGGVVLSKSGVAPSSLKDATVSWTDIGRALAAAKGRVVVLLDACHAGHVTQELVVPNDALADSLVRSQRAGALVLAAAKGRQVSFEPGSARGLVLDAPARHAVKMDAASPHGFFTGAVIAALEDGATDRDGDGAIQVSELVDRVVENVTLATGGEQTPWIARRDLFGDFAIARAAAR